MKLFIGIILAVLSTAYANEVTICQGVPHNTFIRDVSNCRNWFRCTPNGPVPGTCPDPWFFNGNTQECDWEYNVQCFACRTTVPVESIPIEGQCEGFIRCVNGRATQHACQNGLLFNNATQQCDLPENVNCLPQEFTCPPNIPPGQLVTFRSQTNCSEWFMCVNNSPTPIPQFCNPELFFDLVSQQCTWPNMTDCRPPPGDGTTQNPGDPPGTTTTTSQPPFNCPSDGHHPHPTACDQFIVCAAGTPHFFSCSSGLHFNPTTRQCDLPSNANCSRN